jgi:hypothetical protein
MSLLSLSVPVRTARTCPKVEKGSDKMEAAMRDMIKISRPSASAGRRDMLRQLAKTGMFKHWHATRAWLTRKQGGRKTRGSESL